MSEKIPFKEFAKLDLRVAKILSAQPVAGKDRLFELEIDLGKEKRKIAAGLRQYYSPDELEGMKVIVVANLEPAKIAGIISEGMLLAAVNEEENKVVLLVPEKDIEVGTRIM